MHAGLIVGIEGTVLTPSDASLLAHPAVAGAILFARNYRAPEQLRALCRAIRAASGRDLLICVDQEGGRVQRFRHGFTALPPPAVIGRWYRDHPDRARDLAYRHGRVMAAEVLGHGVDLSLAPVLDLDRGSRVIGDRALAAEPDAVIDLAGYYLAGMRDAGMKSCGKHFPGHGSVAADTHSERVVDARQREALEPDLSVFRALAGQLDAIMPAHVCYPAVDPAPAGFSPVWIDMLRGQLGFAGAVISDDLDMQGAAAPGGMVARWNLASSAGCDLALVCGPDSARRLADALAAEPDEAFEPARQVALRLKGRAAFTLDDQELVPEFRAWKSSLNRLSGESSD